MGWWGWNWWLGLYIVSFADSTSPVVVGKTGTFSLIEAITTRDSWCYAAEVSKFELIDIADSLHPSVASGCTLRATADATDICVVGDVAYIADSDGGLRMIDVSQPANVMPLGAYMPPYYGRGMTVQDTIAYVGTDSGLSIANVRSPVAPYQIVFYPTQGAVVAVAVRGELAYITNRSAVLDISDPANPQEVGFHDGVSADKVVWRDSLIYVASQDGGVTILRYYGQGGCSETRPSASGEPVHVETYPNPTRGLCQIRICPTVIEKQEFGLYDLSGRLVRQIRHRRHGRHATRPRRLAKRGLLPESYRSGNMLHRITLVK